MNRKRPRFRRRRYFIKKGFQSRFILWFVILIICSTTLTAASIMIYYYLRYQGGDLSLRLFYMSAQSENLESTTMFRLVLPALVASNILAIIISAIFGLFYSHRMAGPVYRLEESIKSIIAGNLDFHIRLRKNDEFKELADALNELITSLKNAGFPLS